MAGEDEPVVFRVTVAGRVGAVLCALAGAAGAVASIVLLARDGFDRGLVSSLIIMAGMTAVAAGAARSRITIADQCVVVRNPLWTHRVRLGEIAAVEPGYSGLRITTAEGRTVTAWAVQKSNWSAWRGRRTRADEVAAAIVRSAVR
ncbi:MAG TPA: PH domain-containing protein [Spirillospora sp.]|nr:PH domain-containing protein [Spirillospora sp.]